MQDSRQCPPPDPQNTSECRRYDKDGKPLGATGGKPHNKHEPYKKHGGEKGLVNMTAMFEAF
jgi:hypothetical protein